MKRLRKISDKRSKKTSRTKKPKDFVVVGNKSYGNALKGIKIYFEGRRPKALKDDGTIKFGKHILTQLKNKYGDKFRWIITKDQNSIAMEYGIPRVRMSQNILDKMNNESYDLGAEIKHDIVRRRLASLYPDDFTTPAVKSYTQGTLARLLDPGIISKLSVEDKEALTNFLPLYISAESVASISELKAATQIKTLEELSTNLKTELKQSHAESWWQGYIKSNILIIQQGYIRALDKLNVAIGDTKYPDFSLVTHDNYLDILEIKKPTTDLLKYDDGRNNYYWSKEIAIAISQVENYIEHITNSADKLRSYLQDTPEINICLKVIRPRGIILAGDASEFTDQKKKDDFRLLSQSVKNIVFLTYDELLSRLVNYIGVLKKHEMPTQKGAKRKASN